MKGPFRRSLAALLTAAVLGTGMPAFAQPGGTAPAPGPAEGLPADPANGPGVGGPEPLQLNASELEQLKEVEDEYERFIVAATQHDQRMRALAKREYETRTADLTKRYDERIANTEKSQVDNRRKTIALLEKFLQDHPTHVTFTPDKMFQLADLYLDESEYIVDTQLAALEASGQPPNPDDPPINADYTKSLQLWEGILTRFPGYRQTPSTLYLLAYYLKVPDERRSLQIFLSLTCANKYKWNDPPAQAPSMEEARARVTSKTLRDPYAECTPYKDSDPELIRYAWVRGAADTHFGTGGEIDDAIAAYLKVADGGNDSKLYAESLYKLAWSYFKRDRLPDAIKRFDDSVKLYDQIVATGNTPSLELREESIQYIAVAFTDPWEGETDSDPVKAIERVRAFYAGRENEPHVRDIWVAMGKAFVDLQAFDQAVESYRIALAPPWELNPNNPQVHQEIVNAYDSKGDKFAADQAAAELATKYAPGTAWYTANEADREAMENQRRIAERALYAAAVNTHSAATQARKDYEALGKKDPTMRDEYLALYNRAIELYRQFIDIYPDSDKIYDFNFNSAEALFWSERYLESVAAYKWVRDHRDLGTEHYIDAARKVVYAYEEEAKRQAAAGTLQPLVVPTVAELRAKPQPWTPQPIPPIYLELQTEYDNYQNIVADPKAAPQQGINAALISLAYLHVDDALVRYQKVLDKFCGNPEAAKAKDGILAIYEARSDFDAIERTNKAFISQKCGDQKTIDLAIAQNRSLNFSRAADLFAKQEFVPAAEAFYKFYKTAPNTDPDLPVALYNAAVAYRRGERPKTAIALFKEFANNPQKNFRESPYYLDAIRLQASSYQAAFDYANAVKTYLELYEATKKAKRLGLKPPPPLEGETPKTIDQLGLDALYNAAVASELNRDFKKAVELYTSYGRIETDRGQKDKALWSIASIYRQSGDIGNMETAYGKWRSAYGKDAGNEDRFVQSFYDVSAIRKRKNQMSQAKAAGQATIDAWKARGAVKGGLGARLAGEWALAQAEDYYAGTWETYEIKKAAKTAAELQKQGADLKAQKLKAEDKYIALDAYGIVEYSMAAKVRFGNIQYDNGLKLAAAPIPTPIEKAGGTAMETYQAQLDANIAKTLQDAKVQWVAVVDIAKQNGISNQWVRLALENLGREFPSEYTVLRQEIIQGTTAP